MKSRLFKIFFRILGFFLPILFSSYDLLDLDDDEESNLNDTFSLKVCDSISEGGGFFYTLKIDREYNMNSSGFSDSKFFTKYEVIYLLEYFDESAGEYTEIKPDTFFVFDDGGKDYQACRTETRERGNNGMSIWFSERMSAKYTVKGKYRFSVTLKGTNKENETITCHSDEKEFICE